MNKEAVLILLRDNQEHLHQLGVRSLAIFGSFARDEAGPESDIDFLVDLYRH